MAGKPGKAALQPPACGVAAVAVAATVLSSFLFGYSICVLDSCAELISVVFEWCGNEWQVDCLESRRRQGIVNALVYLGAALGAFTSGRQAVAELGSRKQLLLSDVFFGAGALMCCLAQGVNALALGRFVSGLGLGLSAIAAPVYIAEVSPRERRGTYAAMNGVFITVGIFASICLGLPQGPPPTGPGQAVRGLDAWFWRGLLGMPLLPALLQALALGLICPVDPPALLMLRGRRAEARSLIYRIYGMKVASGAVALDDQKQAALELQLTELEETVAMAKEVPKIRLYQVLFDPFLRTPLFLGLGLAAFQQLCGINSLMSYSNSLFAEAGIQPANLTLASTVMAGLNCVVSAFSSQVADSWGRRRLLLIGALGQSLAMALLSSVTGGLYIGGPQVTGPFAVVCFVLFVTSFSVGLGAVTWLYLSEIYPMEIRAPALSACGIVNWVSCFIVVYGGRFLSLQSACSVFGTISAAGLLGTYIWVVETKGCSMDDSPLTPRSGRSSSHLLSPATRSPRGNYERLKDEAAEQEEEEEDGKAKAT